MTWAEFARVILEKHSLESITIEDLKLMRIELDLIIRKREMND